MERETQGCTTACRPPRPPLVVRERLGVDQNEQHPADLVAPIRPGVVSAALNQHVARSHERLVLVQDRPDFALEADGVVSVAWKPGCLAERSGVVLQFRRRSSSGS